jgi:DeoR/GlpR family transcriptional regulator of sugar metabolism
MRTFERHELILKIVQEYGSATVEKLCEELHASPATVRRDVKILEANHLLQRFHGGARRIENASESQPAPPSLVERLEDLVDEKERIAAKASESIQEGDVIALTGGSTNIFLARHIRDKKNITIVTNCIHIAAEFVNSQGIEMILIGGNLRYSSMCMVGPLAEYVMKKVKVSKIFMGVEGIDLAFGITTHNFSEARIDKLLAECADEVIVVADNTKFGKKLFSDVIPIKEVDKIITNEGLDSHLVEALRNIGVKCVFV